MLMCKVRPDLESGAGLVLQAADTGRVYTIKEKTANKDIGKKVGAISVPCGRVRDGENESDTMVREGWEESGYMVRADDIKIIQQEFSFYPAFHVYHIPIFVGYVVVPSEFVGKPYAKDVSCNGWMSPEDLLALSIERGEVRPETPTIVRAVLAAFGGVNV